MANPTADPCDRPSQSYETIRGQFAGLLVGSAMGLSMSLVSTLGVEPTWHYTHALAALYGMLMGGFLGVLAGFIGGVTLRFMRGIPVILASTASGCAVAFTVVVTLHLLGLTSPSSPGGFPIGAGLIAGIVAGAAAPWIRRWPSKGS